MHGYVAKRKNHPIARNLSVSSTYALNWVALVMGQGIITNNFSRASDISAVETIFKISFGVVLGWDLEWKTTAFPYEKCVHVLTNNTAGLFLNCFFLRSNLLFKALDLDV